MDRRSACHLIFVGAATAALGGCGSRPGVSAPQETVLEVVRRNGLDRFLRAVDAAGLTETLSGPGPFTVFAPTDRALSGRAFGALVGSDSADERARMVGYHIVPGTFTTQFLDGMDVNYTTLNGTSVDIDGRDGLRVNDANVIVADLEALNGVVHIIDRTLNPG